MNSNSNSQTQTLTFENTESLVAAVRDGSVAVGGEITVTYRSQDDETRTETATIEDAEYVPAGEKKSGDWTWTLETGYVSITYTPDGRNTHTLSVDDETRAIPTVKTEVNGHSGGQRYQTLGKAFEISVTPADDEDDSDELVTDGGEDGDDALPTEDDAVEHAEFMSDGGVYVRFDADANEDDRLRVVRNMGFRGYSEADSGMFGSQMFVCLAADEPEGELVTDGGVDAPELNATTILSEDEEREAVYRHVFMGQTQQDTGAILGVSGSTVSNIVAAYKRGGTELELAILDQFTDAEDYRGDGDDREFLTEDGGPREAEDALVTDGGADAPLGDRVGCLACGMSFPRDEMADGCPGCDALAADSDALVTDGGEDTDEDDEVELDQCEDCREWFPYEDTYIHDIPAKGGVLQPLIFCWDCSMKMEEAYVPPTDDESEDELVTDGGEDVSTLRGTYNSHGYETRKDGFEDGDRVALAYKSPYSGTVVTVGGVAYNVSAASFTLRLDDGREWGVHGESVRSKESSRTATGKTAAKNGRTVGYVRELRIYAPRSAESPLTSP